MGSKIIAITGLVVSIAFVYFCVNMKKDTIAVKCGIKKQLGHITGDEREVTDEKIVEVTPSQNVQTDNSIVESSTPAVIFEKSDPAFGIILGEQINVVGMFEPKAKEGVLANYIEEICSNAVCINDVRYSDDIKHVSWGDEIVELIQFMQSEKIKGASLYINSNILHIEGNIVTPEQKSRLEQLEQEIKKAGLVIEDKTSFKAVPTKDNEGVGSDNIQEVHVAQSVKKVTENEKRPSIEKVQKRVTAESKEKAVATKKSTVSKISDEVGDDTGSDDETIAKILKENPITFISNNNQLSTESQKVLDRVVEKLQNFLGKKVLIEVCAHTGDDRMVNMIVAQKRATIIQRYLRHKGIKKSTTKGAACDTGEEHIAIEIVE